eukprot:CAMPEP_0169359118 /NCGR_PEP_ID=MMETSP1017-20121227/29047_1 /TAXON_ID=342587 /ORGANISM="Karlodinium micrum, Strain CCMP2283" /LENGTH=262 /DNA_ID=CAMNT_0009456235 /DNA_START=42 /DNA_END=827 /DNA_ORIENTATION=+
MTEPIQVYEEALSKVFSSWTLLQLAVDQGWGGRDSRAKRQQLQVEMNEILMAGAKKRRPPSHQNEDDVQELAEWLYNRCWQLYHAEADDGSDVEVARVCLKLFNTCRDGDVSFAREFMQACQAADLSKCQGVECIEYATEEDQLIDGLQNMDIEMVDEGLEGASDSSMDDDNVETELPSVGIGKGTGSSDVMGDPQVGYPNNVEQPRKPEPPEPVVDEDGFTSVEKASVGRDSHHVTIKRGLFLVIIIGDLKPRLCILANEV